MKKFLVGIALLGGWVCFVSAQCPIPPPATNPSVVVISPYEIQFQIDPIIPGQQQGFHAERSPDNGIFSVINNGYPNGIFHDSFELLPGQEFCYRTRAFNSCGGNSTYTAVVMIRLPNAPMPYLGAPGAPTNLTAVVNPNHSVTLQWTPGAFPTNIPEQTQVFQIHRSTDNVNWSPLNSIGGRNLLVDATPVSGQSYYYRVRSFNKFGWATGYYGECTPNLTNCGTAYTNVVVVTIP